ncbi:MAG: M50 family metallopeptidase, partial [Christensenellaceae bacterium]
SSVPSATEDSRSLDAGSAPVSDGRATSADFPPSANSPSASAASSADSPSALRPESAVPVSRSSEGKKFNDQPPWKRIIVLIAGATMNYFLALVIIIIMFTCVGQPQYAVMQKPDDSEQATSQTVSDSTDTTRLLPGDVIVSVEGKSMFLLTDYVDALRGKKAGDTAEIEVVRNDRPMTLEVVLAKDANFKNMSDVYVVLDALGIYGLMGTPVKQSFFGAVGDSFVYSGKLGGLVLRSLGELLTGKMGLDSMGGPVTTIKATSEAALSGIWSFLNISGFIGVNLAVFNLLPIPALDGSKVVFTVIEWIRKKPINRKVEAMIHFIGIIFLFGFAILVDILQLFV